MQHVDIGIVGGGIVGLTLAAALKDSSLSVGVIDKHPLSTALGDKATSRVSAINQANITALQNLNVWPHVQPQRTQWGACVRQRLAAQSGTSPALPELLMVGRQKKDNSAQKERLT